MTRRAAPPSPRVPGFASAPARETAAEIERPRTGPRPVRQLNVRVDATLLARYRDLLRECENVGIAIPMTELVHALLYAGPTTPDEVRAIVRAYRRDHDDL